MSIGRLTRINTIWRKELVDTLRDRRTLFAMILVPMALYPAMILGSLQGFEFQFSQLKKEEYRLIVAAAERDGVRTSHEAAAAWIRTTIDTDPAGRPGAESMPAEEIIEKADRGELSAEEPGGATPRGRASVERARADGRRAPPAYVVLVGESEEVVERAVRSGDAHVGAVIYGAPPGAAGDGAAQIRIVTDQTDIRSQIASGGVQSIIDRAARQMLRERLDRARLPETFISPIETSESSVATPEKVGGSILGQIVPLVLIIMTITGAIYPAIDLTAGERERGTLETLMVAPVSSVDLIAGKFVVVALIGMLSAALNLLSIGGTILLGGLGEILTRGGEVVIPLGSLPWVLLLLIPLAVMFSALLLAVCSFARSFKEAQNYVMPVMVAGMIPAVVGILPGTRLEGPLLVTPVANISILIRDLFNGLFSARDILIVTASTALYAGAAVAVAARLFGQEAVLFADSGSIRTIFQRKFFKPSDRPSAAMAFLVLALTFSLNFFAQNALLRAVRSGGHIDPLAYFGGVAGVLALLMLVAPLLLAIYSRVRVESAFSLNVAPPRAWIAALCLGLSTWILATAWFALQSHWYPLPPEVRDELAPIEHAINSLHPLLAITFLALVPAVCEEFMFRGFALSGLRSALGPAGAVVVTALAFGLHHQSAFRLVITIGLGLALAMLVIRFGSIWPAVLAHLMHNGIAVLASRRDGLEPVFTSLGYVAAVDGMPPAAWIVGAAALTALGLVLCAVPGASAPREPQAAPASS